VVSRSSRKANGAKTRAAASMLGKALTKETAIGTEEATIAVAVVTLSAYA
jgi:hypothetical protein